MQAGERVEPWTLHGVRRKARWRRGHNGHWACQHVTLGQLPDGRWWVELSGEALAYPDEATARQVARRVMASHDQAVPWVEVPAEFDAHNRPTGPGWVRRGGEWVREAQHS